MSWRITTHLAFMTTLDIVGCGAEPGVASHEAPSASSPPSSQAPAAIERSYLRVELERNAQGAISIMDVASLSAAMPPPLSRRTAMRC